MRRTFALLVLVPALSGCLATAQDKYPNPARGVESVHQPVVSRTDYALDLATAAGSLPSTEEARLDAWFNSLQLGYGDSVFVDGIHPDGVRKDVERIAGQYGLLLSDGSPVTNGEVQPGTARVVVSRTRASVPGCPNWTVPLQPSHENLSMSNHGCSVNGNLAAMIANPEDLVHGRDPGGIVDNNTATRAVESYRAGKYKALQSVSTK